LKEGKTIQIKDNEEEYFKDIDVHCSISTSEKNLNILIDFSPDSKLYRNVIAIMLIPILSLFILVLFINYNWGILFLTIFFFFISHFFVLYLFYKNRKKEWRLDKQSNEIIYDQLTPSKKSLRTLNFSEIEYLIYTNYKWGSPAVSMYSLLFHLENMVEVKIFVGRKEKCEELGIIMANFLEKPLYKNIVGLREKII